VARARMSAPTPGRECQLSQPDEGQSRGDGWDAAGGGGPPLPPCPPGVPGVWRRPPCRCQRS
jgi:hypothetical protein